MRIVFVSLSVAGLVFVFVAMTAAPLTRADHTGRGMNAMSIDMDGEAAPANTDSSLGAREICGRINENNSLDADEDVIDGLLIDITAEGVPPYHDSGTPSDVSDDTGGIRVFHLRFGYSAANLTLQAESIFPPPLIPGLHMLQRNPGSGLGSYSDPTPDNNSDDDWSGSGVDLTPTIPEDGSGVLTRLTLVSEPGAGTANYPLILGGSHLDGSYGVYDVSRFDHGFVAINTACDVDGDGVSDAQDDCDQISGPPSNNGCPPPGPPAVGGNAGLLGDPASAPAHEAPADSRWMYVSQAASAALAIAVAVFCAQRLRNSRPHP